MQWKKHHKADILKLLKAGKDYEEIGKIYSTSKNAIRLFSNRCGFKFTDFNKTGTYTVACLNCGSEITFIKKNEKIFCNSACAATYNNTGRVHSQKTEDKQRRATVEWNVRRIKKPKENKKCICGKKLKDVNKSGLCIDCLKTKEGKKILSALMKGKTGGYRVGGGNSQHKGSFYNGIWMDSSWETKMAKQLDSLKIIWGKGIGIFIEWIDANGIKRKYHPDFYLPEYNLYIEVKGYWTDKSRDKMERVFEQNDVTIIILESVKEIEAFNHATIAQGQSISFPN